MTEYRFTIPLDPRTKKNHQQIRKNMKTGQTFIAPSKQYTSYLSEARWILQAAKGRLGIREPLQGPVNVKAMYYMRTRNRVDISNLHECLHDVLVACGILADDSCRVIIGTDGSRIRYDKENPRTEVMISVIDDEEECRNWKAMFPKKSK